MEGDVAGKDIEELVEALAAEDFGFDAAGAVEGLHALHELSGLDAALFAPMLKDDGSREPALLYTTGGCARCCPRCLHRRGTSYWGPDCQKRHLSAAMLADRHGGKYVYVCPENKIFISAPVMNRRSLRAAMILGPTDVSDEGEDGPTPYPCYEPFEQRTSGEFHNLVTLLAAVAEGIGDGVESYLRRVGKDEKLDMGNLEKGIAKSKSLGSSEYPVASEQALGNAVRAADSAAAAAALDRIFAHLISAQGGASSYTGADNMSELVVVISRAALDAGVRSGIVFPASEQCKREIAYTSTYVQAYRRIRFFVEEMIGFVNALHEASFDDVIVRVQSHVQAHFDEPLTLERVGEVVGLSPAYLSRMFKEKTGVNFVDYVNRVRIEASKVELLSTDASIEKIARSCGFESVSYFSRVFKRAAGMTPGLFRKRRGKLQESS